jgi:prepilin-type N-terminal cleavage/methylation domain-containing protein
MKPTPKKQNGFTLIEIVIVLAIAALIMVIVFLAVQGAQRSRRDTQRKSDLARIGALLENSAGAHSGNYPNATGGGTWTANAAAAPVNNVTNYAGTFGTSYLNNENLTNPSNGQSYPVTIGAAPACTAALASHIYYQQPQPGQPAGGRSYRITMCLESGSSQVQQP